MAILLTASACIATVSQAAPGAQNLFLRQKCMALGGEFLVYLGAKNLRIENKHLIIIATVPDWTVSVLSPEKKVYVQSSYQDCLKHIHFAREPFTAVVDMGNSNWRKGSPHNIAGLPADEWLCDSDKGAQTREVRYSALAQPQFPARYTELIKTCYGISSKASGIPLKLNYKGTVNSLLPTISRHHDVEGDRMQAYQWLETLQVKKIDALPSSLFKIPQDFKRTSKFVDLQVGKDSREKDDSNYILKDLLKNPDALFESL